MKKLLVLFMVPALMLFSKSCDKSKVKSTGYEMLNQYVTAYTGGTVSRLTDIDLQLVSAKAQKIDKEKINQEWIKIKPASEGMLEWKNDFTLTFKPKKPLKTGQEYEVVWKLPEILGEGEEFVCRLQTPEQHLRVETGNVKAASPEKLSISGTGIFADYVETTRLKQIVEAQIDGEKTPITISADTMEGYTNRFTWQIDAIERRKSDRLVKVTWNTSDMGFSDKGEWKLQVPAREKFEVLEVKTYNNPEQYVAIWFSDPIRKNQNLKGLINLGENRVKYTLEDNLVKVYPETRLNTSTTIRLAPGIRNSSEKIFREGYSQKVNFQSLKPQIKLVREGVVLPSSEQGLLLPFETVNLAAVDVYITKIYENNIHQFLQVNNMDGKRELKRVGKGIIRKTVKLNNVQDYGQWTRHHLNLNELFDAAKGAVYRVALGYRKELSVYDCGENISRDEIRQKSFSTPEKDSQYWTIYERGYFPYSYRYVDDYWQEKKNPCHEAYYRAMNPKAQNLLATDMGILAQQTKSGETGVLVTDLKEAVPMSGIEVKLYDYQNQVIASENTNNKGLALFKGVDEAFLAVANKGEEKSYLKIDAATQQNLSNYAIGGKEVQNGLKGFIYGERGVWRPGDSIFVTFILKENPESRLPEDHPVILKMYTPRGDLAEKKVQTKSKTGFHAFRLHTANDAPTGNWRVKVETGGATFSKSLRIETVKPNRLKIHLDFEENRIVEGNQNQGELEAKWLHGAKAPELKAKVELSLAETRNFFNEYPNMIFRDYYMEYNPQSYTVFEGKTNEEGKAVITAGIDAKGKAPGVMEGYFFTKVFETGGNFSVNQKQVTYHPYTNYVGFTKPESDQRRGMLLTGKDYDIELQTVNYKGQPAANHRVRVELYKLEWRWWWETDNRRYNYASRLQENRVAHDIITTDQDGKGAWNLNIDREDWGRYLLRFKDMQSAHVASQDLYFSYPGWWRDLHSNFPGAAARLSLSLEKERYNVGQTGTAVFPGSKNARAFITIENGSKVLKSEWINATKEKNRYEFDVTREMVPNIYVHVNLIQPHSNTENDLPLRMYGIVPAGIEEPETHLHPEINMPDELTTDKSFTITVSERDRRDMTYTLAIVDEGLLDLTNFSTPGPWDEFFAKEALGVETWDMYDWVVGALGGKIGNEVQIGGDMRLKRQGDRKANRFKPVVKFLGPFTLTSRSRKHELTIEDYIGSVRTMVVAGSEDAYGHADKSTPVTKPLMVLGTLPRVLGPGETLKMPVSVFVNKEGIGKVNLALEVNDALEVTGSRQKTLEVSGKGELEANFGLKVKEQTGLAKVTLKATSGSYKANYSVELDVRNPNPYITNVSDAVLEKGESMEQTAKATGIPGTNSASLEVSTLPALNLNHRLDYLMRYPHGCVEQVVSSVFPQLYLSALTELTEQEKQETTHNIKAAIKRLRAFQDNDGGMAYWPGKTSISEWGTNYAGHFLVEAQNKGYQIPGDMLDNWQDYQVKKARRWIPEAEYEAYIQAYRLYTLALAGKTLAGPMNRLRNDEDLNKQGKWRLAAAYAVAGKERVAEKVIAEVNTQVASYRQLGRTYGSDLRDKAMILETLLLLDKRKQAFNLLKEIAGTLSENHWLSTQETAYSLLAAAKYAEQLKGNPMEFAYTIDGTQKTAETQKAVKIIELHISAQKSPNVKVVNNSRQVLYTRVVTRGKPATGEETSSENGLRINTSYLSPDKQKIDPASISQGSDFYAKVTLTNTSATRDHKELVLSQVFPSGWEIVNRRMFNTGNEFSSSSHDYQDIRDDRVYTYFDLRAGKNKTFYVLLNASFQGTYYLPAVNAEAMYDTSIYGRQKGMQVQVTAD